MAPTSFTRIVLQDRPKEGIESTTFKRESVPYKFSLKGKEAVVHVEYLSLDPAMRGWLNDTRSYVPPVKIGETMRAFGLGKVVEAGPESKCKIGDTVKGTFGWTEYALMKDKDLEKAETPPNAELLDFLGPLGLTGMTAYFGLLEVGKIKAGETLVVSGAAGATGSVVCQIGKLKGARVIGIAGSNEKCAWLESELGIDKALNYKSPNYAKEFREAVGYLDVFFDNVGGDILNLALTRLNKGARIVLCGAISGYNSARPKGLTTYLTLISMRAKMEGFIVFDYQDKYAAATAEMVQWISEGKLKRKYHIVEGLEKAPEALQLLFNGGNTGKLVVKVSKSTKSKL